MDQGPTSPGARSRTFSFHSHRSDKSSGSKDLTESPREKARRDQIWKSTSKANPNAAITELQPGVKAILEENTLTPLRGVQHRDAYGNVITDPDLSNPTRPRLERPLDTIRSFEKAIDNGYKRRSGYMRSESYGNGNESQYAGSRRNSGYGIDAYNQNRTMNSNNGGYYGGQRPDSYAAGPSGPPRRYPASRMNSEPMMYNNGQRPHPHAHQHSQDTMNTGVTNGSDSTGPWANSTDPSSENSSIERGQAPNGYPHNGYGPNGYGAGGFQNGIPEDGAYPINGGAPPVQPPYGARRPIALGNSDVATPPGNLPSTKRPEPEKRKSWLKRAFSKKE